MSDTIHRRPIRDRELEQWTELVAEATQQRVTNATFFQHPQVVSVEALGGEGVHDATGPRVKVFCNPNPGAPCPDGKSYPYDDQWLESFRRDLLENLQFLAP